MDVRVRLVFADDVGRHVQRRRGFSSCWYLVPKDAKLVGDLAHALLQEFGLRKRCPKGLELRLEELPVLATQSIRIVRDNDTIVVQCPPLERKDVSCSETSSSESEVEDLKQRKRKARVRKKERKEEQPKKKVKTLKDAQKEFKDRQSSNAKSRGKSEAKTLVGAKKSSSSGTGSSSESSSSSSSESSSSSSESEDGSVAQRNRKRVAQVTTTSKQQPDTHKDTATTKTSSTNGVASKTNAASGKSGKEPRRRRRRLRQRSGGRQRNGNQASIAESSASLAPLSGNNDTASQRLEQVAAAPEQSKQASSSGGQNGVSVAGLRGYPHAKTHVLFDEVTGDQVEVERDENRSDIRESRWTAQSSQAPELAKYGPSSSGNQRSRTSRDNHDQFVSSSSGLVNGDDEINDYNDAPKRKGKCKYEERWKRPYKIVATVLGKKPGESSLSTPDLTKSLASYPTAPAASFAFVPKDVIAFKTLTLCLETWQPVLSEWQCGQVQSMAASGDAIELSNWILAANGDSIHFDKAPISEQHSVQTSEISELRFLSGPNYSSLQQNVAQEEKNATKTMGDEGST